MTKKKKKGKQEKKMTITKYANCIIMVNYTQLQLRKITKTKGMTLMRDRSKKVIYNPLSTNCSKYRYLNCIYAL